MIKRMCRVIIISLKTHYQALVHALQDLGCLHIDDIGTEYGLHKFIVDHETIKKQEMIDYKLTQVEGYLEVMNGAIQISSPRLTDDLMKEIEAGLENIAPQIQQLITKRSELKAELDLLPRYEQILRRILTILPESASHPNMITTGIFVNHTYARLLDDISHQVFSITSGQGETNILNVDEDTRAMLLTFPNQFSSEIEAFIGHQDVSRLRLPGDMEHQSLDTLMERLQARLQTIPADILTIDSQLESLASVWRERLSRWRGTLADELEALRMLASFGETETTCVVVGWVSAEKVTDIRTELQREIGEAIIVHEEELSDEQKKNMPIALDNVAPVQPFEDLVRLRALPMPGDIDPSRLMAVFMPLFFGMMLGDIGYGAILLAVAMILRRRFRDGIVHDLLYILAAGSVWAIVWGLLFGELFGTLGEHVGLHAVLFTREHPEHLVSLLVLTIGAGAVHQTIGLLIGLWQAWQQHNRSHLLERGGMLIGLLALFLIVGIVVESLPGALMTPAIAGLIVGVVLLSASMGWLGIIMGTLEFVGLIGNVLSYLRIAAIGLASVYLAVIANEIAGLIGSVMIGVLIAVLLHALNIVLGAFSPSIQSMRLQYVEFFRKFYTGGGKPFEPFQRRYS